MISNENHLVLQAVIEQGDAVDGDRPPLRLALFNQDGTPFEFESGGDDTPHATWDTIAGKPAVVASGADAASARASIGAGTSNLVVGTGANQAKAGNYTPTWGEVTGKPAVIASGADAASARTLIEAASSSHTHTASDVGASPSDHTHTPASIGAAPTSHTHTVANVTGLQSILDDYEQRLAALENPAK